MSRLLLQKKYQLFYLLMMTFHKITAVSSKAIYIYTERMFYRVTNQKKMYFMQGLTMTSQCSENTTSRVYTESQWAIAIQQN